VGRPRPRAGATRAATLAEYRNRHSVYQFTEAGYRAHLAVESVLMASLDDAGLSRLVFADLLADLAALADTNQAGDAEEVFRKINRLDRALADIAERAARFYQMLGDLARTNDVRPEVFLTRPPRPVGTWSSNTWRDAGAAAARWTSRSSCAGCSPTPATTTSPRTSGTG
jgi:hypothetical protein